MTLIQWSGSIADQTAAIRRSGRNEGGGTVTLAVPESAMEALAQLLAVVECELLITVEVAGQRDRKGKAKD